MSGLERCETCKNLFHQSKIAEHERSCGGGLLTAEPHEVDDNEDN